MKTLKRTRTGVGRRTPSFPLGMAGAILLIAAPAGAVPSDAAIDVAVSIPHDNAIMPVVGSFDGYAMMPPQLVVVSVPFAPGVLAADAPLAVLDVTDRPLPTEATVLSRWADRSVRWAQLRFESHNGIRKWDPQPYALAGYGQMVRDMTGSTLGVPWDYRVRRGAAPQPQTAVRVEREGDVVRIGNGRLSVRIEPKVAGLAFTAISLEPDAEPVAGPLHLCVQWEDGTVLRSEGVAARQVVVEEGGPLRAALRLVGRLGDVYEWQTRLTLHADEPALRLELTIGGLGDGEIDRIARIWLACDTLLAAPFDFRSGGAVNEFPGRVEPGAALVLHQQAPRFEPPRDFSYVLALRGDGADTVLGRGGRAAGWVRAWSADLATGVALRDFSARGPKAIGLDDAGRWTIDLWPAGDVLELLRARALTHEVLFAFHAPPPPRTFKRHADAQVARTHGDLPYRAFVRPPVPVVDHRYVCRTGALGPLVAAADSPLPDLERALDQNFENFLARYHDRASSYGLLHHGDYVTPLGGDNGGNPALPHWRDHEWEFVSGLFTRYVRHGDIRAYQLGRAAYRHFIDVDVHYTRGVNAFHGYGDHGDMHVRFIGPDWGHFVCRGVLDAYVLTGDRRALAAARRLCDAAVAGFAGDDAIAARFSQQRRGVTWPMLALLRMYEVTGERKYLDTVTRAIDVMDRQRALWMRDGTWMSTLSLVMLEEYHRITGDPGARALFLDKIHFLLESYYLDDRATLGKRPDGPRFGYGDWLSAGGTLMFSAAPFGYAYELTGDRHYLEVAHQLLDQGMRFAPELIGTEQAPVTRRGYQAGATRSDGKWFALINFRTPHLPTAFAGLDPETLAAIRTARPRRRASYSTADD